MTTRRNFLKGTAASGLAFCSCGLLDAARAQERPHLPVTVNGKRIKTIDVHAHCRFHEAVALMGGEPTVTPSLVKGDQEQFIVIDAVTHAAVDALFDITTQPAKHLG